MATLILLSGPCNSGKTTTLNALKKELFNGGEDVVILNELIRKIIYKPIDELRKNAHEYLTLQEQIITKKMEQEIIAMFDTRFDVYIADRAITDSLFYLENYVNKIDLNEEDSKLFCKLHGKICGYLEHYFYMYHLVQFKPLEIIEQDLFRPKYLKYFHNYEYECINRLNKHYSILSNNQFMELDLNHIPVQGAVKEIMEFANI